MGRSNGARSTLLPGKDADPLDLLWEGAWQTLGQAIHWEAHWYLSRKGRGHLPDLRTSSFIRTDSGRRDDYPEPPLVDAIDRRAGRLDWQIGQYERMNHAIDQLHIYDPIMAEIVTLICVDGLTTLLPERRVRHHSVDVAVTLAPYDEDLRKLQSWLRRAWEVLGILLATPENFRKALAANAVERTVLQALQQLRLVPDR